MKGLPWVAAVLLIALSATPLAAGTILVSADLQMLGYTGQLAQAGWQVAEIDGAGVSGTQPLPLTAGGSASGISATLSTAGSWYSRGGPDANRAYVLGTSFDAVVSDLWFTRDLVFSLQLTGLVAGQSYRLKAWHNDSYTLNEGAAAGGGTVHASLSSGTVVSAVDGTVTNLSGSRSDSDFGITELVFQPSSATADVTFTRSGGSFGGVPLNGIELFSVSTVPATVPEIDPAGMGTVAGLVTGVVGLLERRRWRGDRSQV